MDVQSADRLFLRLASSLLGKEGGYVNHPDDKGGPTNWGITQAVARANGYDGDMRNLARDHAMAIYKLLYWHRPHFDLVAIAGMPLTAGQLFEAGVNMGPGTVTRFVQRALNAMNRKGRDWPDLAVDGQLGQSSLGAMRAMLRLRGAAADRVLARAVDCLQGVRYIEIAESRPANESFVYGWFSARVGDVGVYGGSTS